MWVQRRHAARLFVQAMAQELFAYMPLAVAGKTQPAHQSGLLPHTRLLTAFPQVGEARVGTALADVLVSGMGGVLQGVFALDVTNPRCL